MKKIILFGLFALLGFSVFAQTNTTPIATIAPKTTVSNVKKNLIGKWRCVKYQDVQGKEIPVKTLFKTDSVIQIFHENGDYESMVGNQVITGTWKLIKNNTEIQIDINSLGLVKVKLQKIDSKKRVTYEEKIGKFEYQKIF